MRTGTTARLSVLGVVAAVGFGGGCRSAPPPVAAPSADRPTVGADPCTERLHDLCGPLLLYRALHGKLPERLEDLRGVADPGEIKLECPVSGKPYVYDKGGMVIPGQPGIIIVRDPEPSHSGIRWAIAISTSERAQPVNMSVVGLQGNLPAQEKVSDEKPRPVAP